MEAKVIIERGRTTISLTPENDFEKDILEKANSHYPHKYNLDASINYETDVYTSIKNDYRLDVEITRNEPDQ